MRRVLLSATVTAAVLTCLAGPAVAQQTGGENKHNGWWFGVGLGGGWSHTDTPDTTRSGGAGFIRGGGTLSQRFLVGGDAAFWVSKNGQHEWISATNVTASILIYPFYPLGGYVKLGAGLAIADVVGDTDVPGLIPPAEKEYGIGATAGIGWDVRIARNFYLTPNVDFLYQKVDIPDSADDVKLWSILLTVGATWH
jgi:hypothetical protein